MQTILEAGIQSTVGQVYTIALVACNWFCVLSTSLPRFSHLRAMVLSHSLSFRLACFEQIDEIAQRTPRAFCCFAVDSRVTRVTAQAA